MPRMNPDTDQACPAARRATAGRMAGRGFHPGWIAVFRAAAAGAMLLAGLLTAAVAQEAELRISPRKVREDVRIVVLSQLSALQAGDFAKAYSFAAKGIRRQFDVRVFGLLMKRGYAPLLRQVKSDLGVVRDDGQGAAQVTVTVTDRLNRNTAYIYWLVQEEKGWRVGGVVLAQKPPQSDI